jgi:hypothetical protein
MANEITTYGAVGAREDLADVIANISPTDAWFTSNSGSATATQRYHEWQTDVLKTPAANAVAEGADATNDSFTASARTGNYCQIIRATFTVTDTVEATTYAGRKSEIGYETEKKLKELAMDTEYALLINAASASASAGSARTLKGVLGWLTTNTAASAASATPSASEAKLNDILQAMWAVGGKPSALLVGGALKRVVSSFTGNNTKFNTMTSQGEVNAAVEVYRSDFGAVTVNLSTIISAAAPTKIIAFGDMGLWRKAWLRKPKVEKLARTGSATKYMIEEELTLEALNEKGTGLVHLAA